MSKMKKTLSALFAVLALICLFACQQSQAKKETPKELSQEEIIDKGLQAFEHLKDGEIKIEVSSKREYKEGVDVQDKHFNRDVTFEGTFELKPLRVRGVLTGYKFPEERYYTTGIEYEKNSKGEWENRATTHMINEKPVGVKPEAIRYFQTQKDKFKVSNQDDNYVLTFETTDVKNILEPNQNMLLGAVNFVAFRYSRNDQASYQVNLLVSKDNFTPMAVTYVCKLDDERATENLTSKVTFSKQNSGLRVEVPDEFVESGEQ